MHECPEFHALSRRGFLRGSLLAAAATTSVVGEAVVQTSYAATGSAPRVLVVLSMRGAVDGMSLVVPHGDSTYYAARPRIGVPRASLLARDGFFGLHPEMAPLMPMWNAGRMAAVHATGLPVANRSHFAAMEEVEDADPGSTARVGWINRLVGRDDDPSALQAIGLGTRVPATQLMGPHEFVTVDDLEDLTLAGADRWIVDGGRERSVASNWATSTTPYARSVRTALRAVADSAPARAVSTTPGNGAVYPDDDLGRALAEAARTIRGDIGAEVITVDHGSWDHHAGLGTLEWGSMVRMTRTFAGALAAFFTDLGGLADRVTLVTISEFGRRVKENANHGLDHGHGNVMLLLGAGVRGGYHGTWPGLVNSENAELAVTTDYRHVLAEVVSRRLGASTATVFPRFSARSLGVVTA